MTPEIKYTILEKFGSLSDWNGDTEFSIVNWNGQVKYDLRKWGEDGKPLKGLTIDKDEIHSFIRLVDEAIKGEKSNIPIQTIKMPFSTVYVYNYYGNFGTSGVYKKMITYTKWVRQAKYDIRLWRDDFSRCSNGVSLTEKEMQKLSYIIHSKILKNEKDNSRKGSIDTSDIDDLLI